MAVKTVLEMDFQTELNKTYRMRINDAKDDLTGTDINTAMDNIIDKDVFSVTGGALIGKLAARLVSTETSEIPLV